jgi:hypothetical protein
MITYNGIELDYRADTLQSLIIKGGLTKIDNLTDRTGTSSTQFNLPRTAKNELAFGNITTQGAELTTKGDAYITIDGNIFSQGTLYVKGYDNDNFSCLFMGADNDFIAKIKTLPLREAFQNTQMLYLDVNIEVFMQGIGTSVSWGHPQMSSIGLANRTFEKTAPFFRLNTIINKIFSSQGITLNSYFLNSSDYGKSLYWSNFDGTHLSHNGYTNGSNNINAAGTSPNYTDLGTAMSNNNSVTESAYGLGGKQYTLVNDISKLNIKATIEYTSAVEIKSTQLAILIWRGASPQFTTLGIVNDGNILQEGTNYIDLNLDIDLLTGDFIVIGYQVVPNSGYSYPITTGNITFTRAEISHDNIVLGDAFYYPNYADSQTQLQFLKKFLVQFNCVLDVDGDQAYIELQDSGTDPVQSSLQALPSIASEQFDLTYLVEETTNTEIDYLKGDLVHLNQKIAETDFIKQQQLLPYQKMGSYLFNLNTFANNNVEKYEGGFNSLFDYYDFNIAAFNYDPTTTYATTWSDCISSATGYTSGFNQRDTMDWTQSNGATQSVNVLAHWSRPIWYSATWEYLFINTLNQKKNNKIIEVVFRDELGTIVSNRKEYIYKDQVYKIVEWSYDIIKKLVKAKLIMK